MSRNPLLKRDAEPFVSSKQLACRFIWGKAMYCLKDCRLTAFIESDKRKYASARDTLELNGCILYALKILYSEGFVAHLTLTILC